MKSRIAVLLIILQATLATGAHGVEPAKRPDASPVANGHARSDVAGAQGVPFGIAQAADDFRILTFNIWCDGKGGKLPLGRTVKAIRAARADIVGLQECEKTARPLAERLGFTFVDQDGDTALLSRFPIVGMTPSRKGVRIRLGSGREILVFNLHLFDAPYQPYQLLNIPYGDHPFLATAAAAVAAARKTRGPAMAIVLRETEEAVKEGLPTFVVGDFNEPSPLDWTAAAARAGRHPLKVLWPAGWDLIRVGFVDAYRAIHPDELRFPGFTWTPTTDPADPKDHHDRIDFIYFKAGPGLRLDAVDVVGESKARADIVLRPYPSDHRAVAAGFRLERE